MKPHANYIAPHTVDAEYSEVPGSDPLDLPMLAALPPLRETSEWSPALQNFVGLPANWRTFGPEQRALVAASAVDQTFRPITRHVELGLGLEDVIRRGYHRLAPQDYRFNRLVRDAAQVAEPVRRTERPSSLGMSLIAEPGAGKSVSVHQVIQTFPQVIRHRFPEHLDATYLQLVHLTLHIPPDESVKALCCDFILGVDHALGTAYEQQHKIFSRTRSQLFTIMARLAVRHSLGVLILDDLQNLSAQYSGGQSTLVASLVQFTDRLGIPIFAIGTSDAEEMLASHPHLNRRLSAQAFRWKPLESGREWAAYVHTLWQCDTTLRGKGPTTSQIESLLRASKGNFHRAGELFRRAVRKAIYPGDEVLGNDCFE